MSDADLLDLLEIMEDLALPVDDQGNLLPRDAEHNLRVKRKISSFRTAIRQRMLAKQGEV